MEYTPARCGLEIVHAYERWRDKYAREPERCRSYDRRFAGHPGRRFTRWLDVRMVRAALAGVPRGSLILDLPCGGGRISRGLIRSGFRPVVADYSPWMVRESLPGSAGGVRLDAMRLPFRDSAFPAAVCFRFLHSVPPALRGRALRELARTADVVLLNYLNRRTGYNWLRRVLGWKPRSNRTTVGQAVAEAEDAGLRVERCCYKSRLFYEDFVVVARRGR